MAHNKVLKGDLIRAVSVGVGHTQKTVEDVLEHTLDLILAAIASGETVYLSNFGTFSMTPTARRIGRNPATGETVDIPEGQRIKFKPSKGALDRFR